MDICLSNLASGQLEEKFQEAFAKVLLNMTDVNTPYKFKREINIKLTFEQNEDRNDISIGIAVKPKLAPLSPVKTHLGLFKDLRTQKISIEEYGSQLKGQAMLPEDATDIEVVGTTQGGFEQ